MSHAAEGFELADAKVNAVHTKAGPVPVDTLVIAAGVRSHFLTAKLGSPVLLETERGYHVMMLAPSHLPRIPIMSGSGKFFITPMEEGLRVAGTVELAGLDAPPVFRRSELLLKQASLMIPDVSWNGTTQWMGHRPSLADSKPVIGRSPKVKNAYFAFGHGHVGLTAAAPTAEIIAELISGESPSIDIAPFAADRAAVRR